MMKLTKDAMLVAAGALGVLAYQRYGNKVKNNALKMMDNTMDKMSKKMN